MTKQQITDTAREIVTYQLGLDNDVVKAESRFDEDLGADSLDNVELVMAFEDEFDLRIDDAEVENVKTFQDLLDALFLKLSDRITE